MLWHWGWGFGPGVLLWAFMIAFVTALMVALIVRLVRGPRHRYWMQGPHPDDPEQMLRARFARAEIGADEYQQRLDLLRRTSQPPRR